MAGSPTQPESPSVEAPFAGQGQSANNGHQHSLVIVRDSTRCFHETVNRRLAPEFAIIVANSVILGIQHKTWFNRFPPDRLLLTADALLRIKILIHVRASPLTSMPVLKSVEVLPGYVSEVLAH